MNNYVLGLELLVIGMGTVFLSLYLLSVFLHFSGKFFGPESKTNKKIIKTSKLEKERLSKEKSEAQLSDSDQSISNKKIAAVTAAIYKMMNNQKKYRVISIQKSNQNWKK